MQGLGDTFRGREERQCAKQPACLGLNTERPVHRTGLALFMPWSDAPRLSAHTLVVRSVGHQEDGSPQQWGARRRRMGMGGMNQPTCVLAVEKGRYEPRYERDFSRPFAPQAKNFACDLAFWFWGSRPCFYFYAHTFTLLPMHRKPALALGNRRGRRVLCPVYAPR